MDLKQPVFDSVLAIDAQLQRLQMEVSEMDKQFAQTHFKNRQTCDTADSSSPEVTNDKNKEIRKVTFAPKYSTQAQSRY